MTFSQWYKETLCSLRFLPFTFLVVVGAVGVLFAAVYAASLTDSAFAVGAAFLLTAWVVLSYGLTAIQTHVVCGAYAQASVAASLKAGVSRLGRTMWAVFLWLFLMVPITAVLQGIPYLLTQVVISQNTRFGATPEHGWDTISSVPAALGYQTGDGWGWGSVLYMSLLLACGFFWLVIASRLWLMVSCAALASRNKGTLSTLSLATKHRSWTLLARFTLTFATLWLVLQLPSWVARLLGPQSNNTLANVNFETGVRFAPDLSPGQLGLLLLWVLAGLAAALLFNAAPALTIPEEQLRLPGEDDELPQPANLA